MSLEATLERIAVALEKLADGTKNVEEPAKKKSRKKVKEEEVKEEEVKEEITRDELRLVASQYAKKHGRDKALELIRAHGSEDAKLSNIPQENRADFLKACGG